MPGWQMRVDRLIHGNPGDHRALRDCVSELKIDVGPGYRVYYSLRGPRMLLLLGGSDSSSQRNNNVAAAIRLAKIFKE